MRLPLIPSTVIALSLGDHRDVIHPNLSLLIKALYNKTLRKHTPIYPISHCPAATPHL